MSPEQARGKAVDKRSDMWAFGCLLYELLTGKAAFQGEGVHDILASVVRAEPDWSLLPDATPQMVRTLLRRCLQKDKTSRLRDAGDARIEIQEALAAPLAAGTRAAPTPSRTFPRWALLSGFVCLGVAVIVVLAVWKLKPTPQKPVTRTVITLPPGDQLAAFDNLAIVDFTRRNSTRLCGYSRRHAADFSASAAIVSKPSHSPAQREPELLSFRRMGNG